MTSATAPAPIVTSPLVSTQWLADHLGATGLVVLDATVIAIPLANGATAYFSGDEQYLVDGHVPGALFADLIEQLSDPQGVYPFTRPDAARFENAVGELGIDNETTVVVYDSAVGQWAARVWWLFRAFGYDRVAVLDGGLTKWRLEERELETGHRAPEPTLFEATERPESWVDRAYVEGVLRGDNDAALVCSVPPKEFTGEVEARVRAGHIPGSLSAPAARLVDRDTRAVLPEEQLRAALEPALGRPRIVAYCGGGIAAASAALALTLLGERSVAIYDDSLNEWAADPSLPLSTSV